jgi:hypothetical protein
VVSRAQRLFKDEMPDTGWRRLFEDPVRVPRGRQFVTLRDAANYIVKLPKADQQAPEWQAAAEVLMLIREHGGDSRSRRAR